MDAEKLKLNIGYVLGSLIYAASGAWYFATDHQMLANQVEAAKEIRSELVLINRDGTQFSQRMAASKDAKLEGLSQKLNQLGVNEEKQAADLMEIRLSVARIEEFIKYSKLKQP